MVTRAFGAARALDPRTINAVNDGLDDQARKLQALILPTLTAYGAISLFNSAQTDATAGGRAMSSALFGLESASYRIQDSILTAAFPAFDAFITYLEDKGIPTIEKAVDAWAEWNREIDDESGVEGLGTGLTIAGIGAFLLRRRIAQILGGIGRIGVPAAATAAGAGAAGTAAAGGASVPAAAAAGGLGAATVGGAIVGTTAAGLSAAGAETPFNLLNRTIAGLIPGISPDNVRNLEFGNIFREPGITDAGYGLLRGETSAPTTPADVVRQVLGPEIERLRESRQQIININEITIPDPDALFRFFQEMQRQGY